MPTQQAQRHIRWINSIAKARTIEELSSQVAKAVRDLTGADGGAFALRERDHCVYVEVDAIEPLWKGQRYPLTACVCGWSILHREPAIVADVLCDERTPAQYYRGKFVRSLLAVPVRAEDPVGALVVYWGHGHVAGEPEIQSAQTIADAAAIGVENIRLMQSMEENRLSAERRAQENAELTERLSRSLADEAVARELLRQGEERFRNMADNVPAVLWATDAEGRPYYLNKRWSEFTGLPTHAGLGEGWRETIHPDDLNGVASTFAHARSLRMAWQFEYRQRDVSGNYRWMLVAGTPWHAPDGVLLGYVGSVVDITERRSMEDALRSSEERMRFMMMELDHRVKNTLASVLSVCDQTFDASGDMVAFREAFHGRLQAMARTHEALALSKWAGVRVREMVHLTVALVAPGPREHPRLSIDGPDILLPASAATPIAATLHELATNALKHGAWSSSQSAGTVRLDWELAPGENGPMLVMRWREHSPRPISVPASEGFGVSMIRGMVSYELHGTVDLRFPPAGVECDLSVPLSRVHVGLATSGSSSTAIAHR